MDKQNIRALLRRYAKGHCTEEEKAWVEALYDQLSNMLPIDLTDDVIQEDLDEVRGKLLQTTRTKPNYWQPLSAAAILLVFISFAFYFYIKKNETPERLQAHQLSKLSPSQHLPDADKGTLTLSDGAVITLNNIPSGKITEKNGIKITKNKDGLISYQIQPGSKNTGMNTLSTPKGGQYQLILDDGTKIWLNAASSITYPTSFNENDRTVTLKGEAYFEVAKNKDHRFKVITDQQELEVLGTSFNINSYEDEPDIKTTLLGGSVKISAHDHQKAIYLKPGEQSALKKNGTIKVNQVNAENMIAWKNGLFQFEHSNIQQAMRQLARWYDVTIEFEEPKPNINLWGEIHRDTDIIKALEILSYFDLKYKVVETAGKKKITIIH